ncbi:amino acid ABC transporter permease [Candidatus Viridilinea mediisalina]|uniref:Polar amino acid ABC transporter permease n=1 Tax=Candidatus Viridilinea mediisalina TaxID=2024553 RepID=A0A2A6RNX5_9CHLR|nr:ABC transporter permease subunit [Candidatus Viridilinea mediisalina]PDW04540.1 polar amino acid ABC transporter permease [Candidatus Viridilinea mediisalina]
MAISSASKTTIPFYRDTRILAIIAQVVFALVMMTLFWFLYTQMMRGLDRAGLLPSFNFITQPAGFPISEAAIPFDPSRTYGYAFLVGITNTLRVAFFGIILATLLGVFLGIARLSENWLLRNLATAYVEIVRNVPLLLQLFFWLTMSQSFPRVQDAVDVGGWFYLHNRGITMAWPEATASFTAWLMIWVVLGLLLGVAFYIQRQMEFKRRDRPGVALPWALLIAFGVALLGFFVQGILSQSFPLVLNVPELQRFGFTGGLTMTTNFAALLFGLVIYTAVFIGEIVRSGIQAINKGQREAARALGLTPGQTLRLVIFPQALRIMIPPLTSQYLNLTKNSSLAVAIGFPDLFAVAGTTLNQTGQAVPVIMMVMAAYLSISLLTSLFMNWYNKRIQLVER